MARRCLEVGEPPGKTFNLFGHLGGDWDRRDGRTPPCCHGCRGPHHHSDAVCCGPQAAYARERNICGGSTWCDLQARHTLHFIFQSRACHALQWPVAILKATPSTQPLTAVVGLTVHNEYRPPWHQPQCTFRCQCHCRRRPCMLCGTHLGGT